VIRQKAWISLVVAAALLAAACGPAGTPVDPAPIGSVDPPQPAHVGGADQQGGSATQNNCNALASLAPSKTISSGSTMAKIKETGKLTVGVDQTTYLFGFRNPITGNLEGFDIDMAKQVAAALFGTADGHIQFKAIPSAQREAVLKAHQVDMVVRTYSITCGRLKDINFSSVYYLSGQRILVDKASKVSKLSDLANKKVCATKTSTSLMKIASDPSKPIPVSVDNWSDCLVMLQQSQVDAVSTDDVILAGMAAQDPTLKVVGDRFTDENYGIGIPKENEDMVRYVNAVLEDVRAGPWKSSYNHWLQPSLGDASPPSPVYK
jgi:polar amino acid transport system substrate-binding protein